MTVFKNTKFILTRNMWEDIAIVVHTNQQSKKVTETGKFFLRQ